MLEKNKEVTVLPYKPESDESIIFDSENVGKFIGEPIGILERKKAEIDLMSMKEQIKKELSVQELYELLTKEKYSTIQNLVSRINTDIKILNMLGATVVDENEEMELLPTLRVKYDSKDEKIETAIAYTTKFID